ncbi:hypothetical protein [Streptomyces lunalinharesii]|uniref:Lipoprotein n=1 Tax=Streptomyces lunalinharesii TaxID=333384 RepID=A0ABN3S0I8_9ACTN
MNTATVTNRLRGRAGRRVAAALVAAAALGLGATACGPEDGSTGAAGPAASSTASDGQGSAGQSAGGNSGAQGQNGGESAGQPTARGTHAANGGGSGSTGGTGSTGGSEATGGGSAHAGNEELIVGKMTYVAPGRLSVKPEDGGKSTQFLVANATTILGAAAICGDDSGNVRVGKDGYGTKKCSVDQLEKAAKTGAVTVRVSMDRKSEGADTVEEKYHP